VSQESVARELKGCEGGNVDDGVLIDFRVSVARQSLRDAMTNLEGMLTRLKARPGMGINFALIYEIGRAERRLADARSALNRLSERAGR